MTALKTSPLISVVVACWNVEKYINNCIRSILSQSYKNLEILLVDDCSTDSTLQILQSYALIDKRVRVIQRETNGGLSECRNSGILASTGDLIAFVDGDDALKSNTYEEIIKNYDPSIDVYWFGTEIIYEGNIERKAFDEEYYRIKSSGIGSISREELLNYDCSAVNKVFSRPLLEDQYLFRGRYFEDALFYMKFFATPRKILFIPRKLYIYYRRHESIMASTFQRKEGVAINHLFILDDIYEFWKNKGFLKDSRISFQKISLVFFSFAYRFSPPFETARVIWEMTTRLRKWNIGCESDPLLDHLYHGQYTFLLTNKINNENPLPSHPLPPLKGFEKIFSRRKEKGHLVTRFLSFKVASKRIKS